MRRESAGRRATFLKGEVVNGIMPGTAPAEFDSFVRARTPALLRSAHVLTGDRHLAEDLVQNTLARTYRAWPRLHETGNAEAYARKIMYNLQVTTWRRRRLERLTDSPPETAAPGHDDADGVALRLVLRDALAKLGQRQRAVLMLRFFEDLTEAETADMLGITIGTVKSQTAKALARLRVMAPELADHYRQVAQSTRPVDLRDQALATARRQGARKLLVTVTVLLACLLGVGALLLGRTQRTPDPAETPSPSPRTTALPAAASLSGPARADEPELTGFLNVTIDVPAWRGVAGRKCPAGRVKLDDHAQHQVANGGPGLTVENSEDGDVDRDGRMDRVAVLRCGPTGGGGYQVVAYRTDTGGDASGLLGRVLSDDAGVGWAGPPAVKDDGLVELEVADRLPGEQPGYAQHQIRAYRWQGGRFTPWPKTHRFPASPAAATLDVKADPLRMEPVNGGYLGSLRITVTNTGAADLPNGQLTIHLPEALHPSGGEWTGCTAVSEHPETGGGTITIVCPLAVPAGTTHETTWTVIATDRAGSDTGSYAAIGQHPPYTLQRGPDHTRTAIVVRWP